jgi:hypothetical protein
MGIFDRIKNAIWGRPDPEAESKEIKTSTKPISASASTVPGIPSSAQETKGPAATATAASATVVDVAAILDAAVKKKRQKLKWRTSIVDLMKALDLDSSLPSRKELARELGYDGDMKSSAKMNVWLHKQVIQKLKDNGGKIPPDLR